MLLPNVRILLSALIAFLVLFQTLSADPEPPENNVGITNELLLDEPSCFVNSVNVITGHYHENAIDLEVAGPHPLYFQRSYSSGHFGGNLCCFWSSNHYGKASVPNYADPWERGDPWELDEHGKKVRRADVFGDCGVTVSYKGHKQKNKKVTSIYNVDEELLQKYVTNCGDQRLSPGNHVRNNRFFFTRENDQMTLLTGNGYKRFYQTKAETEHPQRKSKVRYFSLSREDHPHNYIIN